MIKSKEHFTKMNKNKRRMKCWGLNKFLKKNRRITLRKKITSNRLYRDQINRYISKMLMKSIWLDLLNCNTYPSLITLTNTKLAINKLIIKGEKGNKSN